MDTATLLPIAALVFLLLAVLALTKVKGRRRGRGRSRRRSGRSGRSLSQRMAHHIPFDRKERPTERRERLAKEFRRYQKEHPGATKMPADYYHQDPGPSPMATRLRRAGRWVKARTWDRAVAWVRQNTSPF